MQSIDLIFIPLWAGFYIYWLVSAYMTRSTIKRRHSRLSFLSSGIVWVVIALIAVELVSPDILGARILPSSIWLSLVGLIITVAGLGFAVWARVHLGKNWSMMPAIRIEHTLTRTGPYRYVRHPIYTGLILALLGTAIGIGYLWVFFGVVLAIVMFVIKFRLEEQILEGEFGAKYAEYKKEVKALIPYVI